VVAVTIENGMAMFDVEGMDKLWSFRSRLNIPLAHVVGVEVNFDLVGRWWHGIRALGGGISQRLTSSRDRRFA
jgi:hypothetical protein